VGRDLVRRVELSRERTARTVARRNAVIATVVPIALMSFVALSQTGSFGKTGNTTVQDITAAPAKPTVSGVADTDSSYNATSSAFAGDGGDTHASSDWRIDTITGNWSSPKWADTAETTNKINYPTAGVRLGASQLNLNATYKLQVRHNGAAGGPSLWSDSVTFTLLLPTRCSNEPGGMTHVTTRSFNETALPGPWTSTKYGLGVINTTTGFAITTDATAPRGDSVGMMVYNAEDVPDLDGKSPASTGWTFANPKPQSVYACFAVKFSSDWQYHSTGTNKIVFINSDSLSGGGEPFFIFTKSNTTPKLIRGQIQGTGAANWVNLLPQDTAAFSAGVWTQVEVLVVGNAGSSTNGIVKIWTDGALTTYYANIRWKSVTGVFTWRAFKWEPTWGGNGDNLVTDIEMFVDEIYLSTAQGAPS
jgi:hypothetical protein